MKAFLLLIITCFTLLVCCKRSGDDRNAVLPYSEMIAPGMEMYADGDLSGAIEVYNKARKVYPDSVSVYRMLTRAYLGLGMFTEAKAMLDKTAFASDTLGLLSKYRQYANWSIFAGDTTALRSYTDSILRYAFHTYAEPYRNAAFNEVFLKDYDLALAHMQRYVAYGKPERSPVNLAFLQLKEGDSIEAEAILEAAGERLTRVLLDNPADTDALFELAEIYAIRKDTAVAMDYLRQAVRTGLGKQWWIYHLISDASVPDPVFGALKTNRRFIKLKDSLMRERRLMRERLVGVE